MTTPPGTKEFFEKVGKTPRPRRGPVANRPHQKRIIRENTMTPDRRLSFHIKSASFVFRRMVRNVACFCGLQPSLAKAEYASKTHHLVIVKRANYRLRDCIKTASFDTDLMQFCIPPCSPLSPTPLSPYIPLCDSPGFSLCREGRNKEQGTRNKEQGNDPS